MTAGKHLRNWSMFTQMITAMAGQCHTRPPSQANGMKVQMATVSRINTKRVSPPPRMMPVFTGIW